MARRVGIAATALAGAPPAPGSGSAGLGPVGRHVGTAIHRALEHLDLDADPDREAARWREAIAADLVRHALPALRDAAVAEGLACWDALVRGPLLARLRALRGRIVARELPVLLAPEPDEPATGFVSGAIDLVYRDERGALAIVDYKTDRPADAAAARARREHYARQGAVYGRALARATGEGRPRFELWWLAEGRVDVVDEGGAPAG